MLNSFCVQGRLVRDVVFKETPNGTNVANFTIANETAFPRQTNFFNCVAWRKNAEFVDRYFKKGDLINITGSLTIKEWTDRNGVKRHEPEVQVKEVDFCGKSEAKSPDVFQEIPVDDDEEELPF